MSGTFAGLFSSCHPPQNCQGRPARVGSRNPVGFIDQFAQLGGRVVAGDAPVLVAQQSLPVLLRYPCCPKSSTEGVLQVVNADRSKSSWGRAQKSLLELLRCSDPAFLPCRIVHPVNWRGLAVSIGLSLRKYPNLTSQRCPSMTDLATLSTTRCSSPFLIPGGLMPVTGICRYEWKPVLRSGIDSSRVRSDQ